MTEPDLGAIAQRARADLDDVLARAMRLRRTETARRMLERLRLSLQQTARDLDSLAMLEREKDDRDGA